jgi:hypothetical protein
VCVVIEPIDARSDASLRPLRLSDVGDIQPGHGNEDRPQPQTERADS